MNKPRNHLQNFNIKRACQDKTLQAKLNQALTEVKTL